jgi:hypothetical protein
VVLREVAEMVVDLRIERYPSNGEPTITVLVRSRSYWKKTRRCRTRCLYLQARGELRTQLKLALRQARRNAVAAWDRPQSTIQISRFLREG